jgi:hypothetical protein
MPKVLKKVSLTHQKISVGGSGLALSSATMPFFMRHNQK